MNPNLLLIYEDSQDFTDFPLALKGPLSLKNTVYSFHLYTGNWNPDGLNRMQRFLDRARQWKVPLFVGEFDGFGYSVNVNKNPKDLVRIQSELSKMMKFVKDNSINWAFWSYSGYESITDSASGKIKEDLLKILMAGY